VIAAIRRRWDGPHSLVIAGPQPMPYADFARAIAAAAGSRPPIIVPFPPAPLRLLAAVTAWLPLLPTVQAAEVRRLTEDKAFDIEPMRGLLGVEPVPLHTGLARTFAASQA
jgi:nucleoside-diphosphate-sugar epimerase